MQLALLEEKTDFFFTAQDTTIVETKSVLSMENQSWIIFLQQSGIFVKISKLMQPSDSK
jgi:hypothetical protein